MSRVFLLSPARASGRRAHLLTRPQANFELARRVQIGDATIGEIFTFCSGLYFRGKLTYARKFASLDHHEAGVLIITPSRGLLPPETPIGLSELREFSKVEVDAAEPRFTGPLKSSARALAESATGEVVLLGSIATGKYVETLLPVFGARLVFPREFVGRGDMSRGGLLLRTAALGEELEYIALAGATRRGGRPPRLPAMAIRRRGGTPQ